MEPESSPPLDVGGKFAAPPSMVTGVQPTNFAPKSSSAEPSAAGMASRNAR